MAEKENVAPRLTRAAAKRAAAAGLPADSSHPTKRKRVALRELRTLSNAIVRPSSDLFPRPKIRSEEEESVMIEEKKKPSVDIASDPESEVDDPQTCSHLDSDISQYLRSIEAEPRRRPVANYIETAQTDVTANMRGVLVDWLVEVAEEYKLESDSLYLTISYIDRFLSYNALNRQKLQLLGVSSMLIASKYEEISPPHVEDFCYITDNTYSKQEVVKMESDILNFLKFEVGNPTTNTFLRRFMKAVQEDSEFSNLSFEFLGNYLAELSLLDYGCLRFLPSMIAASAIFLARFTIDSDSHPWSERLQDLTGYKVSELKDCIQVIHDLQMNRKGSSWTAIREKYKQHRFKCVSLLQSRQEIPASYLHDIK